MLIAYKSMGCIKDYQYKYQYCTCIYGHSLYAHIDTNIIIKHNSKYSNLLTSQMPDCG